MSQINKSKLDTCSSNWGHIPLQKLPKEIDINRLKTPRAVLADDPLLPSILNLDPESPSSQKLNQILNISASNRKSSKTENDLIKKEPSSKLTDNKDAKNVYRLQPTIDSYIINTIKLNEILKNRVSFDQVDFFIKKKCKKDEKKPKTQIKPKKIINSDDDARSYLKQFIIIMSIHSGFTEASSVAIDVLVDVLDHYIESFFKLLKNLQSIHQVDINTDQESIHTNPRNNFYSHQPMVEQALEESGIGTIQEIKDFYVNDIIQYYKQTYKKVSKLYEDYKAEKLEEKNKNLSNSGLNNLKSENDLKLEQFMKENDFLNDESNLILGELLDLNVTHFDEMNKLLQIIGPDPFSLITEEYQTADANNQ